MKIKDGKYLLLVVTLIFLSLGGFVVYLSIQKIVKINSCNYNGVEYATSMQVPEYKEGDVCKCENGNINCVSKSESVVKPTIDKFTRENLKVTPKYQISGTKEQISSLPLKTKFVSVSSKNNTMSITIEQEQMCTSDLLVPIQIGMYNYSKDRLYITNIVNKSPKLYTQECIVSVSYTISNWKYSGSNLSIIYMSESGDEYRASLCNYEKNVYAQDDVYSAVDNCNICKCSNGVSKCTNDRVCRK